MYMIGGHRNDVYYCDCSSSGRGAAIHGLRRNSSLISTAILLPFGTGQSRTTISRNKSRSLRQRGLSLSLQPRAHSASVPDYTDLQGTEGLTEMDKEVVELFEAARKAAASAAADGLSSSGPEVMRCVDALKQLKGFPVTYDVLVSTQGTLRLKLRGQETTKRNPVQKEKED